ncbi:DUF4232 domain-containing protein [Nonomuraea sp. NBC_01738]|uniref:DUF4232 domain-containing protein n=1 Tax=Nonomuraea sp. NBC_01738 TaxID=2976003 RepID=UPI002E15D4E9|nr:DUF4232 domain-containing protein [Nonomuraea sp. NBC_01738]
MAAALLLAGSAAPAVAAQTTAQTTAQTARCSATQLKASLGRIDPGAGQRYTLLQLTNTSSRACWLKGYVGLVLFDGSGDVLRTRPRREAGPVRKVTLRPGKRAESTIHWGTVETGGEKSCPSAAELMVMLPDDYAYRSIHAPIGKVCDQGRIGIAPISG